MYGRLVADDGTAENCPYGQPHLNKTDCTASNRFVFFLGGLLISQRNIIYGIEQVSILLGVQFWTYMYIFWEHYFTKTRTKGE